LTFVPVVQHIMGYIYQTDSGVRLFCLLLQSSSKEGFLTKRGAIVKVSFSLDCIRTVLRSYALRSLRSNAQCMSL